MSENVKMIIFCPFLIISHWINVVQLLYRSLFHYCVCKLWTVCKQTTHCVANRKLKIDKSVNLNLSVWTQTSICTWTWPCIYSGFPLWVTFPVHWGWSYRWQHFNIISVLAVKPSVDVVCGFLYDKLFSKAPTSIVGFDYYHTGNRSHCVIFSLQTVIFSNLYINGITDWRLVARCFESVVAGSHFLLFFWKKSCVLCAVL